MAIDMESLKYKMLFTLSRLAFLTVVVLVAVFWYTYVPAGHDDAKDIAWKEVEQWLADIDMSRYAESMKAAAITTMQKVVESNAATFDNLPSTLPPEDLNRLKDAAVNYREFEILKQWLLEVDVRLDADSLRKCKITSLDHLASLTEDELQSLATWHNQLQQYFRLVSGLQQLHDDVEWSQLKQELLERSLSADHQHMSAYNKVVIFLTFLYLVAMNFINLITHPASVKRTLLDFITGRYLAIQYCRVVWEWQDPQVVGQPVSFKVKFYQRNGHAYHISTDDHLLIEITEDGHHESRVEPSVCLGGKRPDDANTASVVFTVRRAADYRIAVMVRGAKHVRGSPFLKQFLPGELYTGMTGFVNHVSTVVCTCAVSHQLLLEPRDRYGNRCTYDPLADNASNYQLSITEIGNEGKETHRPQLNIVYNKTTKRIGFQFTIYREGCYQAQATYGCVKLKNGDFTILVLNDYEMKAVEKVVSKKSHNVYYEAKLLSNESDVQQKAKKVYCYISPKQLTIKEFYLRIFPKRLFTFRVCPSTKFQFVGYHNKYDAAMMTIDDGCQPRVLLALKDRNIVAASFSKYLVNNIGGSETFKDKQDFFYHELRQLHWKHYHDRLVIKVSRHDLLESTMKAMKHFSLSDWCKNFDINFIGEEGLDWGGVRREWMEMVCTELFDPTKSTMFVQFSEDAQSLVHPNAGRNADLKLKHYEFAGRIVGKCLYESALGATYRQLVKARFTRSFLAQLIGLRVNYRYFEQDDPELYTSKIKYIEENDVDSLDMVFSEEHFKDGKLKRVCELIPNGANITVTNENKLRYLDALAQQHLATNVKDEIDSFLRGLNEFVPDNLLSIFDENELELLMCGAGDYSIADFKQHHVICGATPEFLKVVDWFWLIVSGFTREEMARLLQFTTGCSQLPAGGFSELCPKLQITAVPVFKRLPTAHTCFNQLCLPDYDSMESMRRALLTAINEGYQGFSMA